MEHVDSFQGQRSSVWDEIEANWNMEHIRDNDSVAPKNNGRELPTILNSLTSSPVEQPKIQGNAQRVVELFENNPNFSDDYNLCCGTGICWKLAGRRMLLECEKNHEQNGPSVHFQILEERNNARVIENNFMLNYFPYCAASSDHYGKWDFKLNRIFLHGILNDPDFLELILSQIRDSYPSPS